MFRILVGPLVLTASFLVSIPLVFWRSGAFGLEADGGGGSYLAKKWSVVGSIRSDALSPHPTSLSHARGGIAILMDRVTSRTFAVKLGDLIPGTDLYRINQIGDQQIGVTDGSSQFVITRQEQDQPGPAVWEEEKFSPLSALEAYYQSLSEPSESSGESYQDFIRRVESDGEEAEGFPDPRHRAKEDYSLTITKKFPQYKNPLTDFRDPRGDNDREREMQEEDFMSSRQNRDPAEATGWSFQNSTIVPKTAQMPFRGSQASDYQGTVDGDGEKNGSPQGEPDLSLKPLSELNSTSEGSFLPLGEEASLQILDENLSPSDTPTGTIETY